MEWSESALLAPVPHLHLESGYPVCQREGRVAYGSDSVEVMSMAAAAAREAKVRVLFYASHAPDAAPPRVTWVGRFLRLETPRQGRHPQHDRLRPSTTDDDGAWQIFYEIADLERLSPAEQLPLAVLKKRGGAKLSKAFVPLGPLLIENPI